MHQGEPSSAGGRCKEVGAGWHGRASLQHLILNYFMQHPEAKDTSEGIRLWWLPPGHETDLCEVTAALDDLVDRNWLHGRGTLYALNSDQLPSVRNFLGNRTGLG